MLINKLILRFFLSINYDANKYIRQSTEQFLLDHLKQSCLDETRMANDNLILFMIIDWLVEVEFDKYLLFIENVHAKRDH